MLPLSKSGRTGQVPQAPGDAARWIKLGTEAVKNRSKRVSDGLAKGKVDVDIPTSAFGGKVYKKVDNFPLFHLQHPFKGG